MGKFDGAGFVAGIIAIPLFALACMVGAGILTVIFAGGVFVYHLIYKFVWLPFWHLFF
jgi:hypothetical protein